MPSFTKALLQNTLPFLFLQGDEGTEIDKSRLKWSLLLIASLCAGLWIYERSHTVAISDARIASNVIVISSNRSGWITHFPVGNGTLVAAGDLLVQIDDRAATLAMQEIDIQILTRQAEIERAHSERIMVSEEQPSKLIPRQATLKSAQSSTEASLQQQTAELRKVKVQMMSIGLLDHRIGIMKQELERLQIQRQQLSLDVEDRQVRSPIDAVVDKTFAHAGEFISPGRRLIMLHNPNDIWINANIKETQLRHVRPGMQAAITVDAYPDMAFTATVIDIAQATTSEFALLPNPNPSGNFTKVTQRLRIKLSIEQPPRIGQQNLLKPGMMVEVAIDTRS